MTASIANTWAQDPYANDGLGTASSLGVDFLRQITVTMTSVTSATIAASDFGFIQLDGVLSIVGDTTGSYFVTSFTKAGFTINSPANAVVQIYALGKGI